MGGKLYMNFKAVIEKVRERSLTDNKEEGLFDKWGQVCSRQKLSLVKDESWLRILIIIKELGYSVRIAVVNFILHT